jgi:hypothetical protein
MNIPESVRKVLLAFFLLILPWIIIIIGILVGIDTIIGQGWTAGYYVLAITWFGSGIIFYSAFQ